MSNTKRLVYFLEIEHYAGNNLKVAHTVDVVLEHAMQQMFTTLRTHGYEPKRVVWGGPIGANADVTLDNWIPPE